MSANTFIEPVNMGKITEARAMLKSEMEKAKYAPNRITINEHGIATYTRRGKKVELDAKGCWHLKS